MTYVRHKTFISYHQADAKEVQAFIDFYNAWDVFIWRALGVGLDPEVVNSDNPDYIMGRIRQDFLQDSTVTLVLIGRCTWARSFVDWEIEASLRCGRTTLPNGLLGIVLPSAAQQPIAPARLRANLRGPRGDEGYARWYNYPTGVGQVAAWIEDAFQARETRRHLIDRTTLRFKNNRPCV